MLQHVITDNVKQSEKPQIQNHQSVLCCFFVGFFKKMNQAARYFNSGQRLSCNSPFWGSKIKKSCFSMLLPFLKRLYNHKGIAYKLISARKKTFV